MDRQRHYDHQQRKIIGYEVDVVDGKLVEMPVYEQRLQPSTRYVPPVEEPRDEPAPRAERVANRTRNFRGKSLATAGIFFAGIAGVTYGADTASTYIQHQKIINPAEAYQDFTELPQFFSPLIDTIQTLTKITNS